MIIQEGFAYSDYHYVNGGHDILIVAASWGYYTDAGIFYNDLNYSYEYTSDWGSHVLNNYHLSNDGSSFSSYCLLVGGEDDWGGTTECGIFINDTNVDPAVASWWVLQLVQNNSLVPTKSLVVNYVQNSFHVRLDSHLQIFH